MKLRVLSRADTIKFAKAPHDYKTIIISISNSYEYNKKLIKNSASNIQDILYLYFDDVDTRHKENYWWDSNNDSVFKDEFGNVYTPIQKKDAKAIVDFVEKYKDSVDEIVVHCFAGVSRSAGVCAAIMKALTGKDNEIFGNDFFVPNMMCYSMVMEEFADRGYFD